MTKLDDHIKGIKGWLDKQGYPLEMMVARSLSSQGLGFSQGWHYEDPDTNEAREIDVLSTSYAYGKSTLLLQAIIECKYSEQPIIAFTYKGLSKSPLDFWVPCNDRGSNALSKMKQNKLLNEMPVFLQQNCINHRSGEQKSKL
jgi:hypothetical protein